MLKLSYRSCCLIISFFLNYALLAQDARLQRIELEHRLFKETNPVSKDSLKLMIADYLCSEGNIIRAINLLEKIADSSWANSKHLLLAKAYFLSDNYSACKYNLAKCDTARLKRNAIKEYQLLRLANYNHLLEIDSTATFLLAIFIAEGRDTTGLLKELYDIPVPKRYNIKKAQRRSALLPGAGLYYVNERKHAFGSGLLNFLFIGYTAYSIYTGYYVSAAFTGVPQFMRFYQGGKRASVNTGGIKNRKSYLEYIVQLDGYVSKRIYPAI
jgi:hypothetical protein